MAEPWAEYSVVLKIRKLLIFRDAKNVKNDEIAANWNVSATRTFQPARQFREGRSRVILPSDFGLSPPNPPELRFCRLKTKPLALRRATVQLPANEAF